MNCKEEQKQNEIERHIHSHIYTLTPIFYNEIVFCSVNNKKNPSSFGMLVQQNHHNFIMCIAFAYLKTSVNTLQATLTWVNIGRIARAKC